MHLFLFQLGIFLPLKQLFLVAFAFLLFVRQTRKNIVDRTLTLFFFCLLVPLPAEDGGVLLLLWLLICPCFFNLMSLAFLSPVRLLLRRRLSFRRTTAVGCWTRHNPPLLLNLLYLSSNSRKSTLYDLHIFFRIFLSFFVSSIADTLTILLKQDSIAGVITFLTLGIAPKPHGCSTREYEFDTSTLYLTAIVSQRRFSLDLVGIPVLQGPGTRRRTRATRWFLQPSPCMHSPAGYFTVAVW